MAFELDRKPANSGAGSGDSANSRNGLGAYVTSYDGFHGMNTGQICGTATQQQYFPHWQNRFPCEFKVSPEFHTQCLLERRRMYVSFYFRLEFHKFSMPQSFTLKIVLKVHMLQVTKNKSFPDICYVAFCIWRILIALSACWARTPNLISGRDRFFLVCPCCPCWNGPVGIVDLLMCAARSLTDTIFVCPSPSTVCWTAVTSYTRIRCVCLLSEVWPARVDFLKIELGNRSVFVQQWLSHPGCSRMRGWNMK